MLDPKIQELLDREAIRELVARYNFAFDSRNVDAYLDCWVEDGFVERRNSKPSCRGHAQLAALVKGFPINGAHMCTDFIFEIDGDEAKTRHYQLYLDMGPPCTVSMFGIWNDRLVRTSDGWKFTEKIFDPMTIRDSEVSDDFFAVMKTFERV